MRSSSHFFTPPSEKEKRFREYTVGSHRTALEQPPSAAATRHLSARMQAKKAAWGDWMLKKKVVVSKTR